MHLLCANFDQKLEEVILVHHYDLFLPNFGGHDSTADSSNLSKLTFVFLAFKLFYLYFSLNLRHKWLPDIHCGKQTKLSENTGVPIRHNGRNN